jgi:heme a synthase
MARRLITIGLLITLWQCEDRVWVRWLGVFALVLVVFQGILGGLRVRLDERTLAMIHGFTGPAFFALATSLAVFTSPRWRGIGQESLERSDPHAPNICRLAVLTAVLAYSQIVLGAFLRHMPVMAEPATFVFALRSHLVMAGVLSISVMLLIWTVIRHAQNFTPLRRLATMLGLLLVAQVSLGAGTWIVKYSVPRWAEAWLPASWNNGAIVDGGLLQTHVVTGHVAIGSLLMATSLGLALYSLRFLRQPAILAAPSLQRRGAAV